MYISYKNLQGNDEDDQETKDLEKMNEDDIMSELIARSRKDRNESAEGKKSLGRRKPTLLGNRISVYRKMSIQ